MSQEIPKSCKESTWIGGRIFLDVPMDPPVDMYADVFLEAESGRLRHIIMWEGSDFAADFSQSFWEAVQSPRDGKPYRPGKLVVGEQALFDATKALARMQSVELLLDPDVPALLDDVKAHLEDEFADGPGIHYLADDDVDPELVRSFFTRFRDFLDAETWRQFHSTQALLLQGLELEPIWVMVMGNEETGLGVCLSREAVEAVFGGSESSEELEILSALLTDEPGLGLRRELTEHDWPVSDAGVPIVIRGAREERPNPTEAELLLLCEVMEAVIRFAKKRDHSKEAAIKLSSGQKVKIKRDDTITLKPDLTDDRTIPISLTIGQRKLMADIIPELMDALQLSKKSRVELELPLDAGLFLEEHLSTHLHSFVGPKLSVGRDLFFTLRDGIDEFQSEIHFVDLNWENEVCDEDYPQLSEEAAYSEINEMVSAFEQSKEFLPHRRGPNDRSGVTLLLELAYQYEGVGAMDITEDILEDMVLNVIPRKVILNTDECLDLTDEFRSFFAFAKRKRLIPAAGTCMDYLGHPEFKKAFKERLSDSSTFGMAKSLFAGTSTPAPHQNKPAKTGAKKNRKKNRKR